MKQSIIITYKKIRLANPGVPAKTALLYAKVLNSKCTFVKVN